MVGRANDFLGRSLFTFLTFLGLSVVDLASECMDAGKPVSSIGGGVPDLKKD